MPHDCEQVDVEPQVSTQHGEHCAPQLSRQATPARSGGVVDIEVMSAGTDNDADTPLSAELVAWADIIFVMERSQRQKLTRRFARLLAKKRVVCLDIPDRYAFMAPELVRLLESKVTPHLK